jgi:hypothetical protein
MSSKIHQWSEFRWIMHGMGQEISGILPKPILVAKLSGPSPAFQSYVGSTELKMG